MEEGLTRVNKINSQLKRIDNVPGRDEQYVQALENGKYITVSSIVRNYGKAGEFETAARLLADNNRFEEAIPFYLKTKNFSEARSAWSRMNKSTPVQEQYAYLLDKAITLASTGKSWVDLDASGKSKVLEMSYSNNFVGYMAMGIATNLGLRSFRDPIPGRPVMDRNAKPASTVTAKNSAVSAKGRTPNTKFFMYPNPTKGELSLSTTEEGVLNIYNMQGQKIFSKTIKSGISKLNISEVCIPGIYIAKFTNSKGEIHSSTLHYQP